LIYSGTATSELVYWWLGTMLLPSIQKKMTLIWDNAPIHNAIKIRKLIESHGHKLIFLSPYSPDFNPAENKWSELKFNIAKYQKIGSDFIKSLTKEVDRLAIYEWV
jgi:transposase